MLSEIRKVRVHATSTHLLPRAKGVGLILHATLQELRMLKEFKVVLIKNYPLIPSSMFTHLFNTYIHKTELDLAKSSMSSLEIKCNELDRLVAAHRKLIDVDSTVVGNLL